MEGVALRAVLASTLRSDSTYVDVGTNRGQVLREAVRLAPRGQHLAFEPIPGLAEEVERSFPQVECRCKALGAKPESSEFCHFTALDGWSGLRRNSAIADRRGRPRYITVEVSTLDVELEDRRPTLIKIDVEGAELDVFEGGRETFASVRPTVIFEHVPSAAALYGAPLGGPWDFFAGLGYEVFTLTGEGPLDRAGFIGADRVVNWLARHSELR